MRETILTEKDYLERIADLEQQLEEARSDTVFTDILFHPLYNLVADISESESEFNVRAKEVLDTLPKEIFEDEVRRYVNAGIDMAIELCESKVEVANDLGSEVTAAVGSSYIVALEKIKV